MKEKKHSFHFTCYWRLEGTCVMSNKVRTWWTGSNGSPCEKWRDLILEIKGSERKTEWCCYMCWSGILDCKRHKPHSNKLKPKKRGIDSHNWKFCFQFTLLQSWLGQAKAFVICLSPYLPALLFSVLVISAMSWLRNKLRWFRSHVVTGQAWVLCSSSFSNCGSCNLWVLWMSSSWSCNSGVKLSSKDLTQSNRSRPYGGGRGFIYTLDPPVSLTDPVTSSAHLLAGGREAGQNYSPYEESTSDLNVADARSTRKVSLAPKIMLCLLSDAQNFTRSCFLSKPMLNYKYLWQWQYFMFISGILEVMD